MVDKEPLGLLLCEGGLGSEQGQARARARHKSDPRGREKRRGKEGGGAPAPRSHDDPIHFHLSRSKVDG